MIKPESITNNSDTKELQTATLQSCMKGLNQRIEELDKLPMFRQVEGAKAVMNSIRDTLAAVIFALHKADNEIERLKKLTLIKG